MPCSVASRRFKYALPFVEAFALYTAPLRALQDEGFRE
jgi:hypothetical protein